MSKGPHTTGLRRCARSMPGELLTRLGWPSARLIRDLMPAEVPQEKTEVPQEIKECHARTAVAR